MHKSGMIYVGQDYADALDSAQRHIGAKNHPDTVRRLLDAITKDPSSRRAVRAFINDTSAANSRASGNSRTSGRSSARSTSRTAPARPGKAKAGA